MLKKNTIYLLFIIFLTFTSYLFGARPQNELNIYSGRKLSLIEPLIKKFENDTNIKINIITGKSDAFIERLKLEGLNSPADILLTTDVARLFRAKENNLFRSIDSEILRKNIPKKYRSKDNYWFGFSVRARPIIYSNSRVDQKDLSTYEDLSNNKWKSRICMRSSNNVYNQSLIASLIINLGIKRTEEWMEGLVKNFARRPYGGDRDQIRAVASGECDISIINTYYLANMLNSRNKSDKKAAEKVSIFWPNQQTNGTHVNISGAGIMKGSKNLHNAIKFLEFLSTKESQEIYTKKMHEYSIREDVYPSTTVSSFGTFIVDDLELDKLSSKIKQPIYLASKKKWR